jgi:hypothetical protein
MTHHNSVLPVTQDLGDLLCNNIRSNNLQRLKTQQKLLRIKAMKGFKKRSDKDSLLKKHKRHNGNISVGEKE